MNTRIFALSRGRTREFITWLSDQFELQRGGKSDNKSTMEGLRGLAVFLVFLVHYGSCASLFHKVSDGTAGLVQLFMQVGEIGVDLFFVLSGFLIYGTLISRKFDFFRYMKRRIVRIYPTFLAVFAVYLILSVLFPDKSKIPSGYQDASIYILQNVLLLPGLFNIDPIITVAWSLSYEMFFYLFMPLAIRIGNMQAWTAGMRVIVLLAASALALPILASAGGPVRLMMFCSGAILFEIDAKNSHRQLPTFLGFIALAGALAAPLVPITGLPGTLFRMGAIYIAFFLLCYFCFRAGPGDAIARVFSFTPLRWLGNMSYSYYLVHGLTLNAVFMITGKIFNAAEISLPVFVAVMPFYFCATLVVSAVPFILVEIRYSLRKTRAAK